jgi:hypothetical protein
MPSTRMNRFGGIDDEMVVDKPGFNILVRQTRLQRARDCQFADTGKSVQHD